MNAPPYEIIIGLEVHVQLQTATKLFCGCGTQFGAPPNTQTCPVCLGLPGALPVMNHQAFRLALVTAAALHCEIPTFTKWDRKNYYYPDLPKGYQISQYDLPLSRDGWLEIVPTKHEFEPKRVRIIRAHLEEDAGKSLHDEHAGKADSRIDLNRAGTPLLEIVSYPDMRSPQEAKAYLTELKLLLTYLGVSDCNMQEGSLRVDANINLHIPADGRVVATPIAEVKNVNSFRAVERAMEFEARRQYEAWQENHVRLGGPGGHKTTRGWDDILQVTRPHRQKEESSDYRYFPDPDLPPVTLTEADIAAVRESLGELPAQLRERVQRDYGLDAYDADVLVNQGRPLVAYFETLARRSGNARKASNWVQQDVLRTLKDRQMGIESFAQSVPAESLAELIGAIDGGQLDGARAKDVFQAMLEHGHSFADAMRALGIQPVAATELEQLCRELLLANPRIVADLKDGKEKAVGALVGQARKRNPNASPNQVKDLCLKLAHEL